MWRYWQRVWHAIKQRTHPLGVFPQSGEQCAWCGTTYVTVRPGACLVRHNVCHRATWSVPGAAQRMSPCDLERAWCGTTYVTGRLGACLVRHNVCHRATWSVPGAAQRGSPGDLERAWCGTTYVTGRPGACLVRHNVCHRATWSVPGAAQCWDSGSVTGQSGATCFGVTTGVSPTIIMPQTSAMTFIVYAVTVSLSQGALERLVPGWTIHVPPVIGPSRLPRIIKILPIYTSGTVARGQTLDALPNILSSASTPRNLGRVPADSAPCGFPQQQ